MPLFTLALKLPNERRLSWSVIQAFLWTVYLRKCNHTGCYADTLIMCLHLQLAPNNPRLTTEINLIHITNELIGLLKGPIKNYE